MLVFLIESAIAFSIIYSFYKYVFFQTTHFEWNRFYFYFAIIISVILPLVSFPFSTIAYGYMDNANYIINPADGTGLLTYTENNSLWHKLLVSLNSGIYLNVKNLLFVVYFSGIVRFLVVFAKNNIDILHLINKGEIIKDGKFSIVKIDQNETAFSYFNYLFLGKKFDLLDDNEQKKVLAHEKVHAAQKHSLDILIYELFEIIYWFNPYVRKAKKTLKDLHEYIVDAEISEAGNTYQYSNLLVKLSTATIRTKLVNLFSRNPLMDRIKLLAFPESKKLKKMRFIIGFPVLLLIIISYSFVISEFNRASNSLQFVDNDLFIEPIDYSGQLVSGFFLKKEISKKQNYNVIVSHPEISYATESFTQIVATQSGKVSEIKQVDDWGLKEFEITIKHDKKFSSKYKGLWKTRVQLNDRIEREQVIALSGDKRLYPTFSYQLLLNGKPVDPFLYVDSR